MKKITFLIILLLSFSITYGQQNSWKNTPEMKITGFADVFYTYDFNKPKGTERLPFVFNHNRHHEININLALVKFGLNHAKYRGNFAFQTGTYSVDNYVAEPGFLKYIFEANLGISLNKKNNLWIDAGIFPSHLGFESAISIDNMTLTRSLAAENSPYFLSGAKITFTPNKKWEFVGVLTNGWQRIKAVEGNSFPSFGTQIIYRPQKAVTLNWSTFIGTDDPDNQRRMRYFHNIFAELNIHKNLKLIAGFDIGIQQRIKDSKEYYTWFCPTFIAQYKIHKNWSTAFRAEYYQDTKAVIIPVENNKEFRTLGLSWNLDYNPHANISCRVEGRWLNNKDATFLSQDKYKHDNFVIASSIALKFEKIFNK
ncbi:MAG: porin [Flavobacteriales bacterium]|jgi:hypothetical protein|nr:porin [Flavobacteriales bacterium]